MSGRSIHPSSNGQDHNKGYREFVRSFEALEKQGAPPDAYADLAKDFFDSWTAHGFNNCYKARSWCRRLIWLTLCLSLLTLCLILCYQVVQGYLLQPKTVHIKVVHETITEFPAITVCNLNPFPLKDSVPKGSVWEHLVQLEADFDHAKSCDGLGYSTHYGSSGVPDYFADQLDYGDYDAYNETSYPDGYNESTLDGGSKRRRRSTHAFSDFEDLPEDLDLGPFDLKEAAKGARKARSTATGGTSGQGGTGGGTGGGTDAEDEDEEDPGIGGAVSAQPLSKEEVTAVRISCSKYYRLLKKISEIRSDKERIGTEHVPKCTMENFHEQVRWSHICQVEVIDDNFGSYTYYLREYNETRFGDSICSPTCQFCGPVDSSIHGTTNTSLTKERVRQMFEKSYTADFSDVMGRFTPSSEDLSQFADSVKNFFVSCSFDGWPCFYTNFWSWPSDRFGSCYTFNSRRVVKGGFREPRKTYSVGPGSGLRLTLNINASNYLAMLSPEIGLRVVVHDPRVIPFPEDEGFNIPAGVSTSVSIKKKKYKYLEGTCYNENSSNNIRTIATCRKWCLEKMFWRQCNCTRGQSPSYRFMKEWRARPTRRCSYFNIDDKLCIDFVNFEFLSRVDACDCVSPCEETIFDVQTTYTNPNLKFFTVAQNLKNLYTGSDLCSDGDNSTARLHIYLNSLDHEVVEELASYTWETLLCNVGGNFGLFIGLSIVSVAELFEVLFDLLVAHIKRRGT